MRVIVRPVTHNDKYGAPEVMKTLGVPYRFVDYWTLQVLPHVPRRGSGVARTWCLADIARLRAVKELLDQYRAGIGRIRAEASAE